MKETVRFALVQYKVDKGSIEKNIRKHKALCASAANLGANVITFPELSLAGYELQTLSDIAISHSSPLISELSNSCYFKWFMCYCWLSIDKRTNKTLYRSCNLPP